MDGESDVMAIDVVFIVVRFVVGSSSKRVPRSRRLVIISLVILTCQVVFFITAFFMRYNT